MEDYYDINMIPMQYAINFDKPSNLLANQLLAYIVFDKKPVVTPSTWQDVEIFIRYKKRDVGSLEDWQIDNAIESIALYRLKYIIEHLTKAEIIEVINKFYQSDGESTLEDYFGQKFHAPIDSLILTQEKLIITKDKIDNFDQIFNYPAWIEFDDEATEAIFDKIYKGELKDEQIDYFLGASDTIKNYDKWFNLTKHILTTTNNFHIFWTAGDVLSIIRRAVPADDKSQDWFDDQIFEIFWPRVNNTWPMLHQDIIDFEQDNDTRILKDSIGWLETIHDIKQRLPELGRKYKPQGYLLPEEEFNRDADSLLKDMKSNEHSVSDLINEFLSLAEITCSERCYERLITIANDYLIPMISNPENNIDTERAIPEIKKAIKHGKEYYKTVQEEGSRLVNNLIDK